jgi:dihydroorotase
VVAGGTVVDEQGERRADVVVVDGMVAAVAPDAERPARAVVLDAGGCLVTPGLVDLHTHLREPGGERAETVVSGSRAAVRGGYTAVVAMPNTEPATDCLAVVRQVQAAARDALCRVVPTGAITVGRRGERLAPLAEMAAAGVRLFTDDGTGVQDGALMRRALEYARGLGVTLAQHCEDRALAADGLVHEGSWASLLGIPGQPASAEEAMVARDLALVRVTGARLHLLHLSTAGSLALVAAARAEGLPVTAEVAPHHLALTDAELARFDTACKVHPPLRTAVDALALRRGCAEGVVDAVATDHAPHPAEAKEAPLDEAPPGMIGLETAWPVVLSALHRQEPLAGEPAGRLGVGGTPAAEPGPDPTAVPALSWQEVVGLLSWRPARIAGLSAEHGGDQGGPVAPGRPANLAVLDPDARWQVTASALAGRSRNTPWLGRTLTGAVRHTIVGGEVVVMDAEVQR